MEDMKHVSEVAVRVLATLYEQRLRNSDDYRLQGRRYKHLPGNKRTYLRLEQMGLVEINKFWNDGLHEVTITDEGTRFFKNKHPQQARYIKRMLFEE